MSLPSQAILYRRSNTQSLAALGSRPIELRIQAPSISPCSGLDLRKPDAAESSSENSFCLLLSQNSAWLEAQQSTDPRSNPCRSPTSVPSRSARCPAVAVSSGARCSATAVPRRQRATLRANLQPSGTASSPSAPRIAGLRANGKR